MIVVLDFGGQYVHLIARRVKDLGASAHILPYYAKFEEIKNLKPDGIILSGGPASISGKDAIYPDKRIFGLEVPIMGICYGEQLIAAHFGAKLATRGDQKEYGKETIDAKQGTLLFKGLKGREQVWMSHGDAVTNLPKGFEVIGSTKKCPIAAFENNKLKLYGVQFHPEAMHTLNGSKMIENFVFGACKAKKDYSMKGLDKRLVEEVKQQVGNSGVIMAVSGGVDSMVTATLLNKAVPEHLYCLLIDTGLMRKYEVKETEELMKTLKFKHFEVVNSKDLFLGKLAGVTDPEEKRKIIGHTFIEEFERRARELSKGGHVKFLAQGTIYADRIESAQASDVAQKIKSHHNLTLPEKMHLKLVEPLKDLYKDEVRALGEMLGVPKERVWRHPFPGPGLAIRVLGEITEEKLEILRNADYVFTSELKKAGLYDKIWQAFAALIPVKTVGVSADLRTYDYMIALRAINSKDGMTADWAKIPYKVLEHISSKICNDVAGVNRVMYDVSQKPPATIEYE